MTQSTALVAAPLVGLPTRAQWATVCEAAKVLVQSGLLPKGIDTPQKAAAIILKGAELGIPPMHAFAHIAVINGKPSCSAELHLALLARGGVTWEWSKDGSDGEALIIFHRPGFPKPFVSRFTLEDAKRAGVLNNPTWGKYPAAMLRARAVTAGARLFGADLLAGMSYTPEELGAQVDADGEVVEIEEADIISTDEPPALRTSDEPEDIDFDATVTDEALRRDLYKSIAEVEKALNLAPDHIKRCRIKHAETDVLRQATTAGVRAYLERLLEYQRDQLVNAT